MNISQCALTDTQISEICDLIIDEKEAIDEYEEALKMGFPASVNDSIQEIINDEKEHIIALSKIIMKEI